MRYILALLLLALITPPAFGLDGQAITASDIIAQRPWVDVRAFMDGKSGRPTLEQWQADKNTDVTLALQAAANAASNGELVVPQGKLTISRRIKLPASLTIRAANPKGATGASIIRNTSNSYVFEAADNSYFRYKISGITFDSVNGIDLRTTSSAVVGLADIRDNTFVGGDGTGVAIMMLNNDFSNVADNDFYGWKGFCAINVLGWYGAAMKDFKATTQIDVVRNIFSAKQTIGISMDIVDAVWVHQNDFGSTPYPIDIGGSLYYANLPGSTGYYKRGAETPADPAWGRFAGYGWFADAHVFKNHFEYSTWAVVADGGALTTLNKGLVIESNNIWFSPGQKGGVSLKRTEHATVANNIIEFRTNTAAECIRYAATIGLILDKNRIFSSNAGVTTTKAYVDGGGNYFSHIVKAASGGDYDDPANVTYSDIRTGYFSASDTQSVSGTIPAGTMLPAKSANLFKKIQSAANLSQGQQTTLFTVPSEDVSGIIMIDVVANGVGRTSSTWAVGKSSVARISNEASTPALYTIKYNPRAGGIVLESAYSGNVRFEASGIAMVVTN